MKAEHSLINKTVVITGASSGAGRAAALAFAAKGSTVVLAARRTNALEEVVEECHSLGARAVAVTTDVSDADGMNQLADAANRYSGRIDVWVNNAGVLAAGEFTTTPIDVLERVIRINLMGYINGAHAVLPYFKKQGHGILINNISVGAWFPTPFAAAYTASKYGVKGFFEALRGELTDYRHIYICDMFPAFLDTPGIQHAANYTGKALKPAPPVYDPERLAAAMVDLARHPREYTTTDLTAPLLRLTNSLFPVLTRRATAALIKTYLNNADPIEKTAGNLFSPLPFGTGIYGGWRTYLRYKVAVAGVMFLGLAAAGSLIGILLKK
ncbi:MAG TPA: SDR family oxidoreductase [Sphingobacteriaceae bacterium]